MILKCPVAAARDVVTVTADPNGLAESATAAMSAAAASLRIGR
jgi:hypothetical protein